MISEEEARVKILALAPVLPVIEVSLAESLDRFSAGNLSAEIPLPAFDNSAMDGYAVMAESAQKGAQLKIVGEQPAGISKNLKVARGEAVRIFTGAPLPPGADAVVMQEETRREGDFVVIESDEVVADDFVRRTGGDLALGQNILRAGERITVTNLPLLASQGIGRIEIHAPPSVAIITTGDELIAPGRSPRSGEIFETNAVMLAGLAAKTGAQVALQTHSRDDFGELCAVLRSAVKHDAVVISGGVSVGEKDFVQAALREIGAEIDLWRVRIKPGKPFLFGRHQRCVIFGLPGNPVSSFVTFLVLVRPALLKMMGAADELELPRAAARLAEELAGDENRPHYVRGRISSGVFSPVGRQESHALFGLARANALLRVECGARLAAGDFVEVLLIP